MSTKHMLGPWQQMNDGGPSRFVFTGDHCLQAACVEDACLIAAAPELYDGAVLAIEYRDLIAQNYPDLPGLIRALDALRAAIAKATGATP